MRRFIEIWFSNFKLARKYIGGHWEQYYVDHPICSDVWHKVDNCSLDSGVRPNSLCRGRPTCEHHG